VVAVADGTARAAVDTSVSSATARREKRPCPRLGVGFELFEEVSTGVRVGRKAISLTVGLGLMAD
jgi:hypothetical protein